MALEPAALIANIEKVIRGKRLPVSQAVAALLADGHLLIEDAPGSGKTVLAKALARSIDARFSRVQFTPDLLPSDITGVSIFNEQSREFEFRPGPVFANILLGDELNRATPRTQSALLEAMEERQTTAEGTTRALPDPFFVIATQNPIEQEGVYRLPEAQLDRFLLKIRMGFPDNSTEAEIVVQQTQKHPLESLQAVAAIDDVRAAREQVKKVYVAKPLIDYIVQIVAATRQNEEVALGASPRASLALRRISQAMAYCLKRNFVGPDLIKGLAPAVLRHRMILTPQAQISGRTPEQIVSDILGRIETPVCDYEPQS